MPTGSVPGEWLLGTWVSGQAHDPTDWAALANLRVAGLSRREPCRLTLVFTPRRIYLGFGAASHASSYRVLWQNATAAFVTFGPRRAESGLHLHFLSPQMFWIHTGRNAAFFTRQDHG